jgi:hypothetical protein
MDNPKSLSGELENRLKDFHRYYISYCRAYNETQWELEEIGLLIKTFEHSSYNIIKLNESLYRYAETSINTLFWLKEKEYPFVHSFLREWRNESHHKAKIDFKLYELDFHVNGETFNFVYDYYVYPTLIHTERMNKKIKEYFGDEHIVTDATVAGLLKNHHDYMLGVFSTEEKNMSSEMPEKYSINANINKRLYSGSGNKYISNDEFWNKRLDNS